MTDGIVLQFGELANASCVHLWNSLSCAEDASMKQRFFGASNTPRTMIYSHRRGLKAVISQMGLQDAVSQEISADASKTVNQPTGFWTDYNYYTTYADTSYRELASLTPTASFLATLHDAAIKRVFVDDFEEDVRRLAESCDSIDAFSMVTEAGGSCGALSLHALEFLNDEYGKKSKTVVGAEQRILVSADGVAEWQDTFELDGRRTGEAIKLALTYGAIREHQVTWLPILSTTPAPHLIPIREGRLQTQRFLSGVYMDLFGAQSVPGRSSFAALKVFTPETTVDLTRMRRETPLQLSSWRSVMIPDETYDFVPLQLVTLASFDREHFASKAEDSLDSMKQPGDVQRLLRGSGADDEPADSGYYSELTEQLHRLKDSVVEEFL